MYSDAVIRHALDASRAGALDPRGAVGRAGDVACGDTVEIELRVEGGTVTQARHRSLACPHGTAAAALLCELVEGRDLLDAARVGQSELDAELKPREGNRACVAVAVDALHAAIAAALEDARLRPADGRIAVAMSGGVDSAVALLKAVEAGMEPVGVTLRLWIDPAAPDSERACCSPSSVRAARSACHALGVPHVTLDLREGFRRAVVEEFVGAHRRGLTPNPCVRCNGSFRFDALIGFADRIGAPGWRPGTTRASSIATAERCWPAAPIPARTSRTCSPRSPRRSWRASGSRWASSTRRRPAKRRARPAWQRPGGPRARRCASSAAATAATSSSATAGRGRRARSWTRPGA